MDADGRLDGDTDGRACRSGAFRLAPSRLGAEVRRYVEMGASCGVPEPVNRMTVRRWSVREAAERTGVPVARERQPGASSASTAAVQCRVK